MSAVPIQNVYYLLCYAWNKLEEGEVVDIGAINSTRLVDLFAKVLAGGTHHLIRRGFDRGYLSFAEDAGRVKGKVDFALSLKRNLLARGSAHCLFDELDYNVLHNRILKTTVSRLIYADELDDRLREELREVSRWLREVEPVRLTTQVFRRVQLHRNNQFYAFLLNICELVYHHLLVDERGGRGRFRDFLRDEAAMAGLFEAFVRNFYRLEQDELKVMSLKIDWQARYDEPTAGLLLPEMRTDVCLVGGRRRVIIECKYYKETLQKNWGKSSVHSQHLYQLFAYLKNKEVDPGWEQCDGVLLYPTVGMPLHLTYEISGHRVQVKTVNLDQDWRGIEEDMLRTVNVRKSVRKSMQRVLAM